MLFKLILSYNAIDPAELKRRHKIKETRRGTFAGGDCFGWKGERG
jgi:hypothetical protein